MPVRAVDVLAARQAGELAMTDNVSLFPSGDVPPDLILQKVRKLGLDEVVVCGWKDSELILAASTDDLRKIFFLLGHASHFVLEQSDE